MLIGTAKPMPTLPSPLPPVSICELIPITCPEALSSGPPELPGLIGASVCSTLSIVKPFGRRYLALQRRDHAGGERAFQVERVADREHRIAHLDRAGVTEGEWVQRQSVGGHAQHGEIVGWILADHLGFDRSCLFRSSRSPSPRSRPRASW